MLLLLACSADPAGLDSAPATTSAARSLDDCGGNVDDDVPEPFRSWFRCADLASDGSWLQVYSVDLPPHPSPYYAEDSDNWEAFDDRGGAWHQNPNQIAAQEMLLSLPLDPVAKGIEVSEDMVDESAGTHDEEYHGAFQGLGPDGTALFTGVAAPGDSIADEEYTFDLYEGHPTDRGTYHHHGANPAALAVLSWLGLTDTEEPGAGEVELYGVMCDGTVVLGCTELDGADPGALDAQNGHVADVVDPDGSVLFAGRYHTHACAALGRTLTPEIQYYEGECG